MDVNNESEKIKKLWNKDSYFQLIEDCQKDGGEEAKFLTVAIAKAISSKGAHAVLDVGCGEGGVVADLVRQTPAVTTFTGIDVAEVGIERAKKKSIPQAEFKVYNGMVIPFADKSFDFVFSTFVFEHLTEPEKVFAEMSRVTKSGGYIAIACPNYGSPFFRSPCNKQNKLVLLLKRLLQTLLPKILFKTSFRWQKVEPIVLPDNEHIMDYDTTVEPNLYFFRKYIRQHAGFEISEANSFWNHFTYNGGSLFKKIFFSVVRLLTAIHFPGFAYYGPFFYILLKKKA